MVLAHKSFLERFLAHKEAGVCTVMPMGQVRRKERVNHEKTQTILLLPAWDMGLEGYVSVKVYVFKVTAPSVWLADLYAPQGVDPGGDGHSCISVIQYRKTGLSQKPAKCCRW